MLRPSSPVRPSEFVYATYTLTGVATYSALAACGLKNGVGHRQNHLPNER